MEDRIILEKVPQRKQTLERNPGRWIWCGMRVSASSKANASNFYFGLVEDNQNITSHDYIEIAPVQGGGKDVDAKNENELTILDFIYLLVETIDRHFGNVATFIPAAEPHDTSYFMSRYIWNPEDDNIKGFAECDETSDTGSASYSSSSYSNLQDEDN